MTAPPVVVALEGHRRFVSEGAEVARLAIRRFPNRELIARLGSSVEGRHCVVLGSVAPPEAQLARLTLAAHTLRRAGAASITALIPYLAYARQDVAAAGESLGLEWLGGLLRASGIEDVVAVDVHSRRAGPLLGVAVRSLSPAGILADALPDVWRAEATFVAPDEGAIERCAALAAASGRPGAVAHLVKHRELEGVSHVALHGEVGERALIVDDILDTGATVASCCRLLRARGVRQIALAATHGLFTGAAAAGLRSAGVRAIWVSDSVLAPARAPRTSVVALAPLLAPFLLGAAPARDRSAA